MSSEQDSASSTVLMLSGDLMFASRVKAAAQSAGKRFQLSGSLPEGDLDSVDFVILDLSTRSGLLPEIGQSCAARCPAATVIAFGPHVQVDKLQAARDGGIETVMTNGQFDREMSNLFG